MVRYFNHVHIMLNNQYRIAPVHQFIQYIQQVLDILKMKTGGWFIQYIKCFACIFLTEFGSQFHTLCFAPAKGHGTIVPA